MAQMRQNRQSQDRNGNSHCNPLARDSITSSSSLPQYKLSDIGNGHYARGTLA